MISEPTLYESYERGTLVQNYQLHVLYIAAKVSSNFEVPYAMHMQHMPAVWFMVGLL